MDDYLPISMLNQLLYCPRRFWYMHVLGEMEINAPVLEGTLQHEHAHEAGRKDDAGGDPVVYRRVMVWSDRLALSGFCDVVEVEASQLAPVEYKHGRQGRWANDEVQLCAQALCLEEMTGRAVAQGAIFYWGSRRRVAVPFDDALRARTEAAVAQARALLAAGCLPAPIAQRAKCRACSLEPICLPSEVERLAGHASGHRPDREPGTPEGA
jgi:CRISPR-associated exonuclease Cas4